MLNQYHSHVQFQARSQRSAIREAVSWVCLLKAGGLGATLPAAGSKGHGAKTSACGVKELIMFIARANAAITQTMYQVIYPSESNSERFNLFLCHVFAMFSVAPYLPRLSDSDSQTNGFLSFFICGRASSS